MLDMPTLAKPARAAKAQPKPPTPPVSASISCRALLSALEACTGVVERRNTIPILGCVLIEIADTGLRFVGTNLDIECRLTMPAETNGPAGAATAIEAATALRIVRTLPRGSTVTLAWGVEGVLTMTSETASFTVHTLPAADFQHFSNVEPTHSFDLEAGTLVGAIGRVSFAISTEEIRYYLNGMHLRADPGLEGECLRVEATDGQRLARVFLALPDGASGMPSVILPAQAAREIARHARRSIDPVKLALDPKGHRGRAVIGDLTLSFKTIDGTYPDTNRVVPSAFVSKMTVAACRMETAVNRVASISLERGRPVKLDIGGEACRLSVRNPDQGEARATVPVELEGEGLSVGFNVKYLTDAFHALGGSDLVFHLNNPGSPLKLTTPSRDDMLVVVMPMRV